MKEDCSPKTIRYVCCKGCAPPWARDPSHEPQPHVNPRFSLVHFYLEATESPPYCCRTRATGYCRDDPHSWGELETNGQGKWILLESPAWLDQRSISVHHPMLPGRLISKGWRQQPFPLSNATAQQKSEMPDAHRYLAKEVLQILWSQSFSQN